MLSSFADNIFRHKYSFNGEEDWTGCSERVATHVMGAVGEAGFEQFDAIHKRQLMPGGRYLYATGKRFHQTQNCMLFDVEDSREGWASLMQRITQSLMTGAGIGVVYSKLREDGAPVKGMGGVSSGPVALMQMVNESGRHIMQGGSRRSAIWAGLHWDHPDVFDFIHVKRWDNDIRARKEADFNSPAPMDMTNISVILDDAFFDAYDEGNEWAHRVYDEVVHGMVNFGEPGFSIDVGENAGEHLRNACTEITSEDNNDICNLGSVNMANIDTIEEFEQIVRVGTRFLLAGTEYSTVPFDEVAEVRQKNRRLGLGLMGLHEWLLKRGKQYGRDKELARWLEVYERASDEEAAKAAAEWGLSPPVKVRAVAPTGTISIIAETTSGIEPIFCTSMKRRYLKGKRWHAQYIVDMSAKRLVDQGVSPDDIEDAYDLSHDVERRLDFQAFVQEFVDHGISSTINLPAKEHRSDGWEENFHRVLIQYLPKLRGVTVYPDGAIGGQPLNKVPMDEALQLEGVEFEEYGNEVSCKSGACGL